MSGGYNGLHDMAAILFGSTSVPSKSKIKCVDTEFTRKVKSDLTISKEESNNRGLKQAFNWCSDIALCLKDVPLSDQPKVPSLREQLGAEIDDFERAKGLFDVKDYFRAAYYSEHLKHPLSRFVHLYSRYCAYEQKINNDRVDSICLLPKNVPGPHLYEIAYRLGPAYSKAAKKENYPAKPKGIIGVGNYEYKTKLTKRDNVQNPSKTSTTAANKMRLLVDHHVQDDDVGQDEDIDDLDIADLGDDIDGIDIDDTDFDDGAKFRIDLSASEDFRLREEDMSCGTDGYLMYLYGVVLHQLGHRRQAIEVLCWAIHLTPLNWAAWSELAELIVKRSTLEQMDLPDVWQRRMFLCKVFVELTLDADCLAVSEELMGAGLQQCTYLRTMRALALRNVQELDLAITEFEAIEKLDPFRLEYVDVYSNLLFVKSRRVLLANLAAKMVQVAKYSVETCCVVGNYLSLRGEHEKSVVYFQRALKLNPRFAVAYTLMGYEYMEMKNTIQAIQCYRNALKINRRDYRAWFGLGQTYEVLKLFNYSLFYFKQAQRLHPYDSRMVTALGLAFEKKDMFLEAKKCYVKSHSVGDMEGTALLHLAKLYQRLSETERAADAYERYLLETENDVSEEQEDQGRANMYMAEFMLKHNQFDQAEDYAKRCIGCAETQDSGKSILKEISHKRALADLSPVMPQREEPCLVVGNRARSSDDEQPRLPPPPLRTYSP